jgi:PAS domain-containing protein
VVHPDFREDLATQMQRVAATGEDARFEFPVIDADGTSIWMESAGRLGNDSDGNQFRVVRLRNVNDSHEIQRQLAESEEMFRHAMMNAPIGMCLIAPDGSFLGVNPALRTARQDESALLRTTWQDDPPRRSRS